MPGLNASPSSVDALVVQVAEMRLELLDHAPLLELVHLDHGREQLEVVAGVPGELLERGDVLREAAAAEAEAGFEEVRPEPLVEADPVGHVDDVRADQLADARDLVDEADPRREEGVRRELDHLRGGDVRLHDRRIERRVQLGHPLCVRGLERPDHDAARGA